MPVNIMENEYGMISIVFDFNLCRPPKNQDLGVPGQQECFPAICNGLYLPATRGVYRGGLEIEKPYPGSVEVGDIQTFIDEKWVKVKHDKSLVMFVRDRMINHLEIHVKEKGEELRYVD